MRNFFSTTASAVSKVNTNKRLGTIGVIGFQSFETAELGRRLVEYGNKTGLDRDQLFPEFLVIGADCKDVRHLVDQASICKDFGCDFVISSDIKDGDQSLSNMIKEMSGIETIQFKGGKNLQAEAIKKAQNILKPRRPNLYYDDGKDKDWKLQENQILRNLDADSATRSRRFQERKKFSSSYSILQLSEFVGVLGGAGPLASASLCLDLAKKGLFFVHHSASSAPGKHDFEIGEGPSYVPHYKNSIEFLCEKLGLQHIAVPCNTAHMRKAEFAGKYVDRIIDIREATIDQNPNVDGYILLGTNRTTGVNLPQGQQTGIYEQFMHEKSPENKAQFYVPNSEQQKELMKSIANVKAGKFSEARIVIEKICSELRKKYGSNLPVILGCTELPLAKYTRKEMFLKHYIDPSLALAEAAKQRVFEHSKQNISKDDNEQNTPSPNPEVIVGMQLEGKNAKHNHLRP